ncbi:MlrC C-terminal domain-containing protein, partial [Vibrio parahaemolyticus]|nr:MlrC C-terminal domain-containing protein [Vibrio parahaemolyticus]
DVELGGKLSKLSGKPVKGKAYVKSISDGHFTIVGPMMTGFRINVGPSVGLQIGGVDVAVVSGLMQSFDNGQMRVCGFDPMDYRIVTLKSANHFRAYWSEVASNIIDSDSPGVASNDLKTVPYKYSKTSVYPLDPSANYVG